MLLAVCVVLCVAMDRLAPLCIVITIVSLCRAYPQNVGTAVATDGQVGIGLIAGGKFGPGSFSVGRPGSSIQGQMPLQNNKDENDGEHIVLSETENDGGQRENNQPPQRANTGKGNTINEAKSWRPQTTPGQGGQGGSGGGQIVIGTIVVPHNKKNKGNKRKDGGNKKPVNDADVLEATFDSNPGNKGSSVQIDEITGGSFQTGTLSIKDKRPTGVVPNNWNAPNKENTGNTADNEAVYTIGHDTNSNKGTNTEDGNVNVAINPGNDYASGSNDGEEPWVWS